MDLLVGILSALALVTIYCMAWGWAFSGPSKQFDRKWRMMWDDR